MDDGGPTASIILFIALILTDMFFYGFGSAINNLNMKEIEKKAKEENDKKSCRLAAIAEHPARYVNMVQIIVTLINIVMGSFYLGIWLRGMRRLVAVYIKPDTSEAAALGAGVTGALTMVLAVAVLIYILLTFGVLLPKRLAARYPEKWAYLCINPVYCVMKVMAPFTWLVTTSANGILRLFGMKVEDDLADVTEEEIISMVNEGHEQGVLLATEAEMVIMTHRNHIVAVEGDMPLKEAMAFMLDANNSRFPVYDENIDHIIGILHLRDAMRFHASKEDSNLPVKEMEGLLREAVFIPETKNIDALFQMMQSSKTQMVIVVDEYGQTSGLIAMEDILEEIVGNILDEYDEDEEYIEATDNADEYIIEGKTPLEELEERFHIFFKEEEFETLNGFMISKLDKIPEENEDFDIDVGDYNFKILSVENKMIQSVLVTKIKQPEPEEGTAEESNRKKEN